MQHHFRSFSFVDRITSVKPRTEIRGIYQIPALSERGHSCPPAEAFPSSLVAESVGQLAAWLAMSTLDFRSRPVAGIASRVEMLSEVKPGQTLELTAAIESIEEDAVAYCGAAAVDGLPVIRLHHCVGPMVPLQDFDDPQAVRDRFHLISEKGAAPGAFGGLPAIVLERGPSDSGRSKSGSLQVPASADFFADHFPRRPVFPGSLLMHSNLQLVAELASELPPPSHAAPVRTGMSAVPGAWRLQEILDMKLRAFIPPGEPIQIEAVLEESAGPTARVHIESRNAKRLAGSAQVLLGWQDY